jgi:hypothetical protein
MRRLWITRQWDGRFMVTLFKPVIATVKGTGHKDAYFKYGEPFGKKDYCEHMTASILGDDVLDMERLATERIWLQAGLVRLLGEGVDR